MKLFHHIFIGILHGIWPYAVIFFHLAGVQAVVSICFSSSVLMLLKSVPELLSSEDDGFETKAIAVRQKIKINNKHFNVIIGL